MNIVGNAQPIRIRRRRSPNRNIPREPCLGLLDEFRGILIIVISVDVKIGNVVAQICHGLLAAASGGAA